MTLTPPIDSATEPPSSSPSASVPRQPRCMPTLEKLATLYPALFGQIFLPLKRGVFQDLIAAQPEVFDTVLLKEALAFHTRSTRYLNTVASGQQRHDLSGASVEAMAPEHVHHALMEVYRRKHNRKPQDSARPGHRRPPEDLRAKLIQRIVAALDASGLSRQDYAERVRTRDEAANAILDEAMGIAASRAAKDEALLRAFDASGQSLEAFADMYGMHINAASTSLDRARHSFSLLPHALP